MLTPELARTAIWCSNCAIQLRAVPQHNVVTERRNPRADLLHQPIRIRVIGNSIAVHQLVLAVFVEVDTGTFVVLDGVAAQNYAAGRSCFEASRPKTWIEVGIVVVIDDIALNQNS